MLHFRVGIAAQEETSRGGHCARNPRLGLGAVVNVVVADMGSHGIDDNQAKISRPFFMFHSQHAMRVTYIGL